MYLVYSDGREVLCRYDEGQDCFVAYTAEFLGIKGLDGLLINGNDVKIDSAEILSKTRRRVLLHLVLCEKDLEEADSSSDYSSEHTEDDSLLDESDPDDVEYHEETSSNGVSSHSEGLEDLGSSDSSGSDLSESSEGYESYGSETEVLDHFRGELDDETLMRLQQYGSFY